MPGRSAEQGSDEAEAEGAAIEDTGAEETPSGEATDAEAADGETADEEAADEEAADEEAPDEEAPDEAAASEGTGDEAASDGGSEGEDTPAGEADGRGAAGQEAGTGSPAGGAGGTGPGGEGADGAGPMEGTGAAGDLDLIDAELAEHERWAGSFGSMGTAGSDERARFLLDQAGQGAVSGAEGAAVMGAAMGAIGAVVGQVAGRRLAAMAVSRGLTATPVPGLGPAIGGVMAVAGLVMRDWSATGETIGRIGTGEGYEGLANDLEGIAEILDVASSIMDVVGGVLGGIAVGMWVGAVLSAGALSPLAATLSAIATGITIATTAIGVIINVVVRPTVTALRALHAFESQGDPAQIEAAGAQLQGAAGQITGAVAGAAAGRAGGRAGGRVGTRVDAGVARVQAGRTGGAPSPSASSGPGPRVHVEVPEAPARTGVDAGTPPRVAAEGPASAGSRPAGAGPAAAAPGGPAGPSGGRARSPASPEGGGAGESRSSRRVAPSEESFADAEFDAQLKALRDSELGYEMEAGRRRPPPEMPVDTRRTRERVDRSAHRRARRNPPPGRVPGAQIQHWTKTLDVTRDLPPGMAPMDANAINANISYLQSESDLPSTTLLSDPAGGGTRFHADDVPRGRTGDQGMPGEQLDLFTPSRGPRDPDYSTEHKFADNYLIPRESERIAAARRQAGLPPLDPRTLATAAGEQARWIMTGEAGPATSGMVVQLGGAGSGTASGTPAAGPRTASGTPAPAQTSQLGLDFDGPAASSPTARTGAGATAAPRGGYASHTQPIPPTRDRGAAMAEYHAQVRADPGRESGVWRDADGNYHVMQGDAGSVRPPSARGPLQLIYHSHPTSADAAARGLNTQPSQAAGDIGVLQHQHGQGPAGARQTSELHFPVYDGAGNHAGYGATRFAYDPTSPLPLQVRTTRPDGSVGTQRYRSFEDFEGRTGIAAGGDTPAASAGARQQADARLARDRAAADAEIGRRTDASLRGSPLAGVREAREAGRQEVQGSAAGAESLAGPAYTAAVPGLEPGSALEVPINPAYPPPPGNTTELAALREQAAAARAVQADLAGTQRDMRVQAAEQEGHAAGLAEAGTVADEAVAGRSEHQAEVAATEGTNTEQQSTAGEAVDTLGQSAQEATALATLVGSLQAFRGMAHLFSYLPGDLGRQAEGAKRDTARLIESLNRVSETEAVQSSVAAGQGTMEADAERIAAVDSAGTETDTELAAGQADIAALAAANTERLAETRSVEAQAGQERAAARASEDEAETTHDDLLARLEAWAQAHRQAREVAIAQAVARYEALGYRAEEEA